MFVENRTINRQSLQFVVSHNRSRVILQSTRTNATLEYNLIQGLSINPAAFKSHQLSLEKYVVPQLCFGEYNIPNKTTELITFVHKVRQTLTVQYLHALKACVPL